MVMPLANEAKPWITPWVTYLLIGANLACYSLELIRPVSFSIAYAATPYELTHAVDIHRPFVYRREPPGQDGPTGATPPRDFAVHQAPGPSPIWLTLITSLFLHANLLHLAGNMLFLSIFGQKIEEAFGRVAYLGCYLTSGVIGTLAEVATVPESLTPILGASGAIAGVMGVYLIWFPRDRVRVLFFGVILLVPAYLVIGGWIAIQVMQSYLRPDSMAQGGTIAHLSHVGGAVVGIVEGIGCWTLISTTAPRPLRHDAQD